MSGMPVGDVVPELVLLAGSTVVLLFALFASRKMQPSAAALALVTLAATAWCILAQRPFTSTAHLTFAGSYALDAAAAAAKLLIVAITAVVVMFAIEWFRSDARQGEFYALLLLSALGAVLLASAADLSEIVLAVLLSSATGYVLTAYHRASRRAAEAAMKYYLIGALSNGVMVFGVVFLFGLAATTTLSGLLTHLEGADRVALVAGWVLVFVGLAFKAGAVPAHMWMPDVADGAPAPVAAFVTAAPKIGALVALARLVTVLPEVGSGWRPVVALVSALTMTLGNVAALRQDDVRRLLGWSAVSQTGYALMGIVALGRSALAIPALLYFLAAYALGNLAAFGVVIALRGRTARKEYAGLAAAHPALALALVVSFLSFIGIPPLAGFVGKLVLFGATIEAGYGWLALLAAANSVISLAYYVRVLAPVYFESAQMPAPSAPLGTWAAISVAVSAVTIVLLGLGGEGVFAILRSVRVLPR